MTLLIKNVQIVGGAKDFPEGSDVFVSDDRISAIGTFPNKKADVILDGQGAYLSPGFIDVNTDSDHYLTLFDHPSQEDFLKQGVTTIMGGMCGSSLAPLLYGSLESLRKWGDTNRVNVNWHTMAEFLATLDKRPLAVNFGTLSGHSTIRRAIIGEALRDLTKNELDVFSRTLQSSLEEGSFGLSTGLDYVHARKAPYSELKLLVDIVKRFNGVYATHLRQTNLKIKEAVEEAVRLAKETGANTLISHFIPVIGAEKEYETALAIIEALPPEANFNFDIYPSSSSMLPIYTFLPAWTQTGGVDVMMANLKDEWLVARIKKDIPPLEEDKFFIAQAPGNDFLVGKSLREIRDMYDVRDGRDALIRLMTTMNLKGSILYENLNMDLILRAMSSKKSFIASNAPSFGEEGRERQLKSERTTSTFTKFLSLVSEKNLMSFTDAIRKITIEPAKKFGLTGRGEIKEGNFADLVCFRGEEVKFTIVNGRVAEKGGEFGKQFAGKALRRSFSKA